MPMKLSFDLFHFRSSWRVLSFPFAKYVFFLTGIYVVPSFDPRVAAILQEGYRRRACAVAAAKESLVVLLEISQQRASDPLFLESRDDEDADDPGIADVGAKTEDGAAFFIDDDIRALLRVFVTDALILLGPIGVLEAIMGASHAHQPDIGNFIDVFIYSFTNHTDHFFLFSFSCSVPSPRIFLWRR